MIADLIDDPVFMARAALFVASSALMISICLVAVLFDRRDRVRVDAFCDSDRR